MLTGATAEMSDPMYKNMLYSSLLYEILHTVGNDAVSQENKNEVFQLLRQAFGFELKKHEELLKQVQNTKDPKLVVRVEILQARELKAKDCNGLSDPYCEIFIDNEHLATTNVKCKTLNPTWNQIFEIPVKNVQKDVLKILVRDHDEPEKSLTKKLCDVREIHNVNGVKLFAKNLTSGIDNKLIGSVKVELKNLPARGAPAEWRTLEKKTKSDKPRGDLLVGFSFATAKSNIENPCQSHVFLLHTLILNHLSAHEVAPHTWKGTFTLYEEQVLTQHVVHTRLTPLQHDLAKFAAYSQVHGDHPLNIQIFPPLMQNVTYAIRNSEFTQQEVSIFWSNAPSLLCSALNCLTKLTKISLEDAEATLILNDVLSIISHMKTVKAPEGTTIIPSSLCPWINSEEECDIDRGVREAVNFGIRQWFDQLLPSQTSYSSGSKENIFHLETVIQLVMSEMLHNVAWTDEIFQMVLKFSYQEMMAIFIDNEISNLTKMVATETSMRLKQHLTDGLSDELPTNKATLLGNAIFNLYHTVAKLHGELSKLIPHARLDAEERHEWFSDMVEPRLEIAMHLSKLVITRSVQTDSLQPVCEDSNIKYTHSALDTLSTNYVVLRFLLELDWPDTIEFCRFIIHMMMGFSDCCVHFAQQMQRRVTDDTEFIMCLDSSECCRAINSIEKVRTHLNEFIKELPLEDLKVSLDCCGKEIEAQNFNTTLHGLVETTQTEMSEMIDNLVHTLIVKEVNDNTNHFLANATKASRCKMVLKQQEEEFENFLASMNTTLNNLKENLSGEHRERVFTNTVNFVWNKITPHFAEVVNYNIRLTQPPIYFQRLGTKLQKLETFFNRGFENVTDAAIMWAGPTNELSCDLKTKLKLHSTSTDDLIMAYHLARLSEQAFAPITYGKVAFKSWFTKNSLKVKILNARDIEYENSEDNRKLYVKIKLLPENKYPLPNKLKTSFERLYQKTLIFDNTFEIKMSEDLQQEKDSMLQVIVMEQHTFGTNTFVGEAFLFLSSLPREEGDEQTIVTLSRPTASTDMHEFKTLKHRNADAIANFFIQEENRKCYKNEFTLVFSDVNKSEEDSGLNKATNPE